jgi:hypothetical protein
LYSERVGVNKARLALAQSLMTSLEIEIDRLNSGYESEIELDSNDDGAPLILIESLKFWAAINFGIEIPNFTEAPKSAIEWKDITISLQAGNRIKASSKDGFVANKHLTEIGLMGKNKACPNESFTVLLGLAIRKKFPVNSRGAKDSKKIFDIGTALKKLVDVSSNVSPFYEFNKVDGWLPKFKSLDKRNAGDQRAKERAIHTGYYDEMHGHEDSRPYEPEDVKDDADDFLES